MPPILMPFCLPRPTTSTIVAALNPAEESSASTSSFFSGRTIARISNIASLPLCFVYGSCGFSRSHCVEEAVLHHELLKPFLFHRFWDDEHLVLINGLCQVPVLVCLVGSRVEVDDRLLVDLCPLHEVVTRDEV